ncbi:unnamed protein product [Penicillium discolor]
MSNSALLERPAVTAPNRTVRPAESSAPLAPAGADLPAVRSPRGFALYVGLDEIKAAEAGVSLPLLVDALRRTLAELAPGAETHATVALAPHGSGGRDLDVGRTIERSELVAALWQAQDDETPGERTIDVHVRRLRAKLGRYEDIVRTVRGIGYRFDRHADVVIRYGHGTPSPDRF